MTIIKKIKNIITSTTPKTEEYIGPILLKKPESTSHTKKDLEDLINQCKECKDYFFSKSQLTKTDSEKIQQLEKLQKNFEENLSKQEHGLTGENIICNILERDNQNLYILPNMNFAKDRTFNTKKATIQIDIIVISQKLIYLLEVKNIFSGHNIEYEIEDNFILCHRLTDNGTWEDRIKKTKPFKINLFQNNDHYKMLSDIMKKDIELRPYEPRLYNVFVLANSKGKFYFKNTSKNPSNILLGENLQTFIRETDKKYKGKPLCLDDMKNIADALIKKSVENSHSYVKTSQKEDLNNIKLYIKLKERRQELSKGIPPYRICTDDALSEIATKHPKTMEELRKIKGFGDKNTLKYGKDILKTISENVSL